MEQAKFAYYLLGKFFEKQTDKEVNALKFLNLLNKKDESKQIEGSFPQNLINDLLCGKSNDIANLQNIIKTDELHYKFGKVYNFNE